MRSVVETTFGKQLTKKMYRYSELECCDWLMGQLARDRPGPRDMDFKTPPSTATAFFKVDELFSVRDDVLNLKSCSCLYR